MATQPAVMAPELVDAISAALPHNNQSSRIKTPAYATLCTLRRNGTAAAHFFACSHLLDSGPFIIGYAERSSPILSDLRGDNAAEIILNSKASAIRLKGKCYLACAPHLLMRFPPTRITPDEDARYSWECVRLSVFARLSPAQRAVLLLKSSTPPKEIADPTETPEAMASRMLGTLSLADSVASPASPRTGRSAAEPAANSNSNVFSDLDSALDNFVVVAFKPSKAEVLTYGPLPSDFARTVFTSSKDGTWTSEAMDV